MSTPLSTMQVRNRSSDSVTATWAVGGGALVAIPATVGVLAAIVARGRRDSTRRLVSRVRR